jgi:hypothetical protein
MIWIFSSSFDRCGDGWWESKLAFFKAYRWNREEVQKEIQNG